MRGFRNSSFDPQTLLLLETAFDKACLSCAICAMGYSGCTKSAGMSWSGVPSRRQSPPVPVPDLLQP